MSTTLRRWRVVVTQRFFDEASIDYLHSHHCNVVIADLPAGQADGGLSEESLLTALDGADGWIVGHAPVTHTLLSALPRLQVVSRRGVGYERVDTNAIAALGRVAAIAVGGNDACVADHALALMLAVGHRLRESQQQMAAGSWSILLGTDLYRKTVGVVGMGRIGRGVIQRLKGFETRILVCSPRRDAAYAREQGIEYGELDQVLTQSDYLTLHAPLTPQTHMLIDASALARMKASACLINTARGGLVDDAALLDALRNGRLAGAGLDVFLSEADPKYRPVTDALLALPHVVATPHSGASTREGLARTNFVAAQNVVAVLEGRTPSPECVIADGRLAAGSTQVRRSGDA